MQLVEGYKVSAKQCTAALQLLVLKTVYSLYKMTVCITQYVFLPYPERTTYSMCYITVL